MVLGGQGARLPARPRLRPAHRRPGAGPGRAAAPHRAVLRGARRRRLADDLLDPLLDAVPLPEIEPSDARRAAPDRTADDRHRGADPGAGAAPAGVAGPAPAGRAAAGRLPHGVPRHRGRRRPTCASTSSATTCATSTGTSPRAPTSRTSGEYLEDREVTGWLLLDSSASMDFGPVSGASTSCSPRSPRRWRSCCPAAATGSARCSSTPRSGRPSRPVTGATRCCASCARLLRAAAAEPAPSARTTDLAAALRRRARHPAAPVARRDRLRLPQPRRAGRACWASSPAATTWWPSRWWTAASSSCPPPGMIYVEDAETGEVIFVDTDDPGFQQRLRAGGRRAAGRAGRGSAVGRAGPVHRVHRRGPGAGAVPHRRELRRRRRR